MKLVLVLPACEQCEQQNSRKQNSVGSGLNTVRLAIISVQMGAVIFSSDRRRDSGDRLKRLLSWRLPAKARIGRVSAFDHAR